MWKRPSGGAEYLRPSKELLWHEVIMYISVRFMRQLFLIIGYSLGPVSRSLRHTSVSRPRALIVTQPSQLDTDQLFIFTYFISSVANS